MLRISKNFFFFKIEHLFFVFPSASRIYHVLHLVSFFVFKNLATQLHTFNEYMKSNNSLDFFLRVRKVFQEKILGKKKESNLRKKKNLKILKF